MISISRHALGGKGQASSSVGDDHPEQDAADPGALSAGLDSSLANLAAAGMSPGSDSLELWLQSGGAAAGSFELHHDNHHNHHGNHNQHRGGPGAPLGGPGVAPRKTKGEVVVDSDFDEPVSAEEPPPEARAGRRQRVTVAPSAADIMGQPAGQELVVEALSEEQLLMLQQQRQQEQSQRASSRHRMGGVGGMGGMGRRRGIPPPLPMLGAAGASPPSHDDSDEDVGSLRHATRTEMSFLSEEEDDGDPMMSRRRGRRRHRRLAPGLSLVSEGIAEDEAEAEEDDGDFSVDENAVDDLGDVPGAAQGFAFAPEPISSWGASAAAPGVADPSSSVSPKRPPAAPKSKRRTSKTSKKRGRKAKGSSSSGSGGSSSSSSSSSSGSSSESDSSSGSGSASSASSSSGSEDDGDGDGDGDENGDVAAVAGYPDEDHNEGSRDAGHVSPFAKQEVVLQLGTSILSAQLSELRPATHLFRSFSGKAGPASGVGRFPGGGNGGLPEHGRLLLLQVYTASGEPPMKVPIQGALSVENTIETILLQYEIDGREPEITEGSAAYELRMPDDDSGAPDMDLDALARHRDIHSFGTSAVVLCRRAGLPDERKQASAAGRRGQPEEAGVNLDLNLKDSGADRFFLRVHLVASGDKLTISGSKERDCLRDILRRVEKKKKGLILSELDWVFMTMGGQEPLSLDTRLAELRTDSLRLGRRALLQPEEVGAPELIRTGSDGTDPSQYVFDHARAVRLQWFEVIKTNNRGRRQPRLLGVDGRGLYNKKIGGGEARKGFRDLHELSGCEVVKPVNENLFQITYNDRQRNRFETRVFKAKDARERAELVAKINYLIQNRHSLIGED